jgi:hypothetical protein
MGGQACVFYGAAEFSRDVDFVVFAETENLQKLQNAMRALHAEVIAVHTRQVERKALKFALSGDLERLDAALEEERRMEIDADRAYWAPLRKEIERLRHQKS